MIIKSFKLFEFNSSIEDICKKYNIQNYTINEDRSIDVNSVVNLEKNHLSSIPLKFRNIYSDFSCANNDLESLEGCPEYVEGHFFCTSNNLKSLKGGPKKIRDTFYCTHNNLTSLEGGPESVGGDFNCYGNKLISLKGSPELINGKFDCRNNKLESLIGSPKSIFDYFDFGRNKVFSFKGLPEFIGGSLICYENPVYEIYQFNPCKDFAEFLNEYDVIRDKNKVVEIRLRQALEDSNCKKIPEEFKFENYDLI